PRHEVQPGGVRFDRSPSRLLASQPRSLLLRLLQIGDVEAGPHQPYRPARLVPQRAAAAAQVPDPPIRTDDSFLEAELAPVGVRALDEPANPFAIIGVDPFEVTFVRGLEAIPLEP